jgi:3-oxoacyl-[acyl-carrier protein] reductase
MYTGKTVLITGSSRGVGKMLADHFISNHATVIGLSRYAEGVEGMNYYRCDLSDPQEIISVMKNIYKNHSNLNIIINNAAVLTSQYAWKMGVDDARSMVDIDLLSPFFVAREGSKLMLHGGRIVNISSMAVPLEPMGDSMYAACKAGLEKMGNIMAKEFNTFGITVNTLGISAIETDMLKQLNKEKIDKVVANLPIPRYATIEDITNVIDFFCSPKSNYITAQTIYLGGVHS